MFRRPKEYSLEELLEHPVLGVQISSEGIDRRCIDLMFDATGSQQCCQNLSIANNFPVHFYLKLKAGLP